MRKLLSVLIAAASLTTGCAYFGGSKTPNEVQLDCYEEALKPAVGDVFDTAELARDLVSGKADLAAVASNLELQPAVIRQLLADLNKCGAPHGIEPAQPEGS